MTRRCDLIIRNAMLYDGLGYAPVAGAVAVTADRIVGFGDVANFTARHEIDARGRALCPGFIDTHTHDERAVLKDPTLACKISQGVTTVIGGNCGLSIAPYTLIGRPPAPLDLLCQDGSEFFDSFSSYFKALEVARPAPNVVVQVGHSTLRVMVMDDVNRPATDAEIKAMRALLKQALSEGAAGFSTGLEYDLARSATSEEVALLAEVVPEFGGFHSTHMRDEGDFVIESIEESARIGRAAHVPVILSHHKLSGLPNHGRAVESLKKIEELARGQALALDAYPYAASSTILSAKRAERAAKTLVSWSIPHPDQAGRALHDICDDWACSVDEAVKRLIPAGAIYFSMDEDDVSRILRYPRTMIGSDGLPDDPRPHPRLWGTFVRILGHYCRSRGLFSLAEAIRRMTSLPARTFGIKDRGVLAEGAYADMVLFNPETVADTATFDSPVSQAEGIEAVWVNGVMTWRRGAATGMRAGRGLKRADLLPLNNEPWPVVLNEPPPYHFALSE